MADKSIMEEMLPMKISNWESIEYSEGICCPNPDIQERIWIAILAMVISSLQFICIRLNTILSAYR